MINGLVGSPGSGKSYEAVVYHILPAVSQGRKVKTNLPLNISEFENRVPGSSALIQILEPEALNPRRFSCLDDYLDDWRHPETNQGPLMVVDEAHFIFRRDVQSELLEYFALHRHYGVDILLVTQTWRQVHAEVRDMVQICYRVRKGTALGFSKKYIRKVQDGVKGEVTNQSIRVYDPKNYSLYKSHTQTNSSVMEAAASDVKPFWRHWSVYAALVFFFFALYGGSKGGFNPFPKPRPKPAESVSVVSSAPVPAAPVSVPSPVSSPVIVDAPVKKDKEKTLDPYYGHGLHIAGYLRVNNSERYQVYVSQNGQVVASIDNRELLLAGYEVIPRGRCAIELHFEKIRRFVVCDVPVHSLNPGKNFTALSN